MALSYSALLALRVLLTSCLVQAALVQKKLTLTWELGTPNGNTRPMIFTNGEFPGPPLIFDEDDDVEITVCNEMPFNATVHWHGLLMQDTPWSDGVPGVTQIPIPNGESFVYRFKAYPAGTYWYHSHSRMELVDGLYGALFIRPKPSSPTPYHLITNDTKELRAMTRAARNPQFIVASDWSNYTSVEYMAAQKLSELDLFCVDSVLVNGKGSVYCPGQEFLIDMTSDYMKGALEPLTVNDKGCLPFMKSTQGIYLPGRPDLIPPHLFEGCIPVEGPHEVIEVDPADGWASLNFIMAGTLKAVTVSIDGHEMWVYEADGGFIYPQKVHAAVLMPGYRYSMLIKLDKKPRDYTIRVPDQGFGQVQDANATLRYKPGGRREMSYGDHTYGTYRNSTSDVPQRYIDYGGQNTTADVVWFDEVHMPPFPPFPPRLEADSMYILNLSRWDSAWSWTMSGADVMAVDDSWHKPLLYYPAAELAMNPNLTIRNPMGSWVDLVLQVGHLEKEPFSITHPVHKHASKMWQVGAGLGIFNYSSVAEAAAARPDDFNFVDPPYRDTFITSVDGASWIVIRYEVNNAGPWLFHCHVELHLSGGMAIVLLDGMEQWPEIPQEYAIDQWSHWKSFAEP